jgi:cytoskeletal protein CcmA (bactofilin family)
MNAMRYPVLVVLLLAGSALTTQQAGETVTKEGTVSEDLYLAGGTVEVRANVQGDVFAVGGDVTVTADVMDDVRVIGGSVALGGNIDGDAIAAGGTVRLRPDATVGGRAWLAGGEVDVAGRISTHLKAGGGKITISGSIDGDVELMAGEIDVLPTARIAGTLTYRSRQEARIDPAAQITGGITRLPIEERSVAGAIAARLLFIAATGVLGVVLILTFPGFSLGAIRTLAAEPWKSLGLGAGVLVGGPLVAILTMVTIVGLALGGTLVVVYGLALVSGCLAGALYVGDATLKLLGRAQTTSVGTTIAALYVGLVLISVLAIIPFVGGVVQLAVLLFGLGAVALTASRAWKAWRAEGAAA